METNNLVKKQLIGIVISVLGILVLNAVFAAGGWPADLYFHRWYVFISTVLRKVLGKIPFSIGDVIYGVWVIMFVVFLLRIGWDLVCGRWQQLLYRFLQGVRWLLSVYFVFLLFWGGHYRRTTPVAELGFDVKKYTTADLYLLADTLVTLTNRDKAALHPRPDTHYSATFRAAAENYRQAARTWPELAYTPVSLKPSLYSSYLNYLGVTGYLNPFTNEAQVNTRIPAFLQPFTTCHEIAHQLGYAPEEDANFIGYITASRSADPRFRYAANFEMLLYTLRQLGRRNGYMARLIWNRADITVREDVRAMILFYRQFEGPLDDYSAVLYDQYLKANRQQQGIRSYSEVVGWLMSYYKL
ncbi:DUF3810 domain-containing protein [Chitinophaga alhagiae]|uniref:DUF3810 domain-containing protein n=1 Tax=Chitinophaga alhagiae TaxID=2203219 RepID=UPI001E38B153|nr:DUF3810 domain-containing protein [Chitinophaga alhagiae]